MPPTTLGPDAAEISRPLIVRIQVWHYARDEDQDKNQFLARIFAIYCRERWIVRPVAPLACGGGLVPIEVDFESRRLHTDVAAVLKSDVHELFYHSATQHVTKFLDSIGSVGMFRNMFALQVPSQHLAAGYSHGVIMWASIVKNNDSEMPGNDSPQKKELWDRNEFFQDLSNIASAQCPVPQAAYAVWQRVALALEQIDRSLVNDKHLRNLVIGGTLDTPSSFEAVMCIRDVLEKFAIVRSDTSHLLRLLTEHYDSELNSSVRKCAVSAVGMLVGGPVGCIPLLVAGNYKFYTSATESCKIYGKTFLIQQVPLYMAVMDEYGQDALAVAVLAFLSNIFGASYSQIAQEAKVKFVGDLGIDVGMLPSGLAECSELSFATRVVRFRISVSTFIKSLDMVRKMMDYGVSIGG